MTPAVGTLVPTALILEALMIGFCTAVCYGDGAHKTLSQTALECVDDYFYLGGKKAQVIVGFTNDGQIGTLLIDKKLSYVAIALKVLSYATLAIPLLMLCAKVVLRCSKSFYLIDVEQQLMKGVAISDQTRSKIQRLLPSLLKREQTEDVRLHRGANIVFSFESEPGLMFKMAGDGGEGIKKRFANTVKGKEVCLLHQLDALVIPQARMIEVEVGGKRHTLIAEERLKINTEPGVQEELYAHAKADTLKATAQLAQFIARTGFSDIDWHKIPFIEEERGHFVKQDRKIALLDLEHMNGAQEGLFGTSERRGLLRCLPADLKDLPGAIAQKYGVEYSEEARKKSAERKREHQEYLKLLASYEERGILKNPTQQLDIDAVETFATDTAHINLLQTAKYSVPMQSDGDGYRNGSLRWGEIRVTLRKVLQDTVEYINQAILASSPDATAKARRYLFLNLEHHLLRDYRAMPFDILGTIPDDKKDKLWLRGILDMLVTGGFIFKLDKAEDRGYTIQA